MVGQKRQPSAIDPAKENFELRPTPVSPFLYGGVANFSWAQHNLHNLHADCTFKLSFSLCQSTSVHKLHPSICSHGFIIENRRVKNERSTSPLLSMGL